MNINAGIIDQRVAKLASELSDEFSVRLHLKNDHAKLLSAAFVFLTAKTLLDLTHEEAMDAMTEGGSDFAVDAIEISDVQDGEFTATLFQGKYSHDLEGNKNFPETGITKAIQAINTLFDPCKSIHLNPMLQARVEEIRSLIQDGNLPYVRFVLCNNGLPWSEQAQKLIDLQKFPDRVRFEHANHETLLALLQSTQPVKETLRFKGRPLVDDFNFIRVFVGKMPVTEIAEILERHGDRLLERNIRRYLGTVGNRVNEGIRQTLLDPNERSNFYFYNNGLTLTCSKFDFNALQDSDHQVKVDNLQIINGGQTCKTIHSTLKGIRATEKNLDQAYVLVRLYQLPEEGDDLIRTITYATNSQNPVDLRDLRSNDACQRSLQISMESLGYHYRRQRGEESLKSNDITSAAAAEAVLSVWRRKPQQAKFMTREHFGKLYDLIFPSHLNGSQVILATLLFRHAENLRKRPPQGAPAFLPYAGAFIAMLMGDSLLAEMSCKVSDINHRNFDESKNLIDLRAAQYAKNATDKIANALQRLYREDNPSLQRLAATFRRGDLFEFLNNPE